MISRDISNELILLTEEYPIVTVLGPRQAGKTTLAKITLANYQYSNLENPEEREFATTDPIAYLNQFAEPVIIDEIQRVPQLLSYIQSIVDADPNQQYGRYILTGSHQLELRQAIGQSLAGRTAIINLLPLSINELQQSGITFAHFADCCFKGFLPRIYDKNQRPTTAYSNYYQTYVERDVRLLINLRDLSQFEKLLKLLAGRVGQIINFSSLANDLGVSTATIVNWLGILEASFILYKLSPYFENFGKRAIKSPKYYFTDVGLLCFLLGIRRVDQVTRDPLVGQIFENLVVIDSIKNRYNKGELANAYFYRDSNGNEVDLIIEDGRQLTAIEIKSATTFSFNLVKGLRKFQQLTDKVGSCYLIYSGQEKSLSDNIQAVNFNDIYKTLYPQT